MTRASLALLLTVVALFAMGLLMVYGTTSAEVLGKTDAFRAHIPLLKQIIFAAISCALAWLIYRFGYDAFLNLSPALFWTVTIMLVLCFVPNVGQKINGASRWIGWGFASMQPSECMKPVAVLFAIHFLQRFEKVSFTAFLKLFALLIIPLFLIILEPDNGTVVIMLASLVTLFFLARVRWFYWGLPLILVVAAGVTAASQMPHVQDRIRVYLNPELDILGKGHQPYQAKIASGAGGLFGRGVGESLQKLSYLPEARCDYIAAIYAEEFGFIGMFVLILLYMTIAILGFWIATHAPDRRGQWLAGTLTFMVTFQAFLNLGVVSGLLPSKGTNLPFFSQGGSSLIMNVALIAFILSVAKKERLTCT